MNTLSSLLQSRKFWMAVLALIQTALFLFRPSFPPELWSAISEVLIVLIVSMTVENIGTFVAAGVESGSAYNLRALALSDGTNRLPWLFRSRKFWLAVVAVVQSVVFSLLPNFPVELWEGINTVILIVIGMYAIEDAVKSVSSAVSLRSK